MGPGVLPAKSNSCGSVTAWCWILMDLVLYGPDHMGPGVQFQPNSNSWVVVLLHGVVFWTRYCMALTGILYMGPQTIQTPSNRGGSVTWCWILMDLVLYGPNQGYHGAGCPNSSQVQQLGGSVTAWCCIWTRYCIALTGILYMGTGVPIPAKSNSWVVVLLHGVVF